MSDNQKICTECRTVNENEYTYCKNCGAVLPTGEETRTETPYGGFARTPYTAEEIKGIPVDDMVAFVGKNSDKIIPKWSLTELSGRKTSWCWPAFVLTLFFGLFGTAFWFLYRRMYKIGLWIAAAAVVASVALGVLTFSAMGDFASEYLEILENYTLTGDETQLEQDMSFFLYGSELAGLSLISNLSNALRLAVAVVAGLFSLHIYKCHAAEKITSFGRKLSDMELSLLGGTSGGALTLGIIFYAMFNIIILVVLSFLILAGI